MSTEELGVSSALTARRDVPVAFQSWSRLPNLELQDEIQLVERVAEHVLTAEGPAATTVLQQKLMQSEGARNEM